MILRFSITIELWSENQLTPRYRHSKRGNNFHEVCKTLCFYLKIVYCLIFCLFTVVKYLFYCKRFYCNTIPLYNGISTFYFRIFCNKKQ